MREILFRGKRTDNGEWVEGYITRRPSAIQYGAHYSPWFIDVPPRDPDDSGGFYNVDGSTVGEFTGVYDKNGTRIFEDDIIKCTYIYDLGMALRFKPKTDVVVYREGNFNPLYNCEKKSFEVIGNIHDNLELLEREAAE